MVFRLRMILIQDTALNILQTKNLENSEIVGSCKILFELISSFIQKICDVTFQTLPALLPVNFRQLKCFLERSVAFQIALDFYQKIITSKCLSKQKISLSVLQNFRNLVFSLEGNLQKLMEYNHSLKIFDFLINILFFCLFKIKYR